RRRRRSPRRWDPGGPSPHRARRLGRSEGRGVPACSSRSGPEMCGIAGIVQTDGRAAGLGHRRLAIIDLATGDQPMASDDGAVWIVFNGEIYNFRELRRDLEAKGARFKTSSDTEVILRAYEAWGPECVRQLRGMFTFAILDERARRVVLARDRVGIKPLFYSWDGRRLLFASELKGLLEDPQFPRTLDREA